MRDTYRALDTMQLFLEELTAPVADINGLRVEMLIRLATEEHALMVEQQAL